MQITASENHTLDALLELVCLNLQLTDTQDSRARGHYSAVCTWLAAEGSPLREYSPHIFPQGSQRLGTTTKPVGRMEFDLDAVCKLIIQGSCSPAELYQLIWDRLHDNKMYRPMMRRMPRCIRLEYAGDFHLDIAPAIPDQNWGGDCLLVPDLKADLSRSQAQNNAWKSTNPVGYAGWFDDQCVPVLVFHEKYARAQVDPVPDPEPIHSKPALKRSVQLYKRWRDVEYEERPKLSPPSIILTTLSGHFYDEQQLCTDALRTILQSTVREIKSTDRIRLTNPAHPQENICEKWDEVSAAYRDFTVSVEEFRDRWERLLATRGIHKIEQELTELFGESPVRPAVKSLIDHQVIKPRSNGSLGVRPGTGRLAPVATAVAASSAAVASSAIAMPSNTFHGD